MNDKKLNELITALSTTEVKNKTLDALREKITDLDASTDEYNKAKASHKKEFIKLSAERTKLEVVKDDLDGKELALEKRADDIELISRGVVVGSASLAARKDEFDSLEKKTRASCRRKENATTKALEEAETLKAEAATLKLKYETKYDKLKDAMNG